MSGACPEGYLQYEDLIAIWLQTGRPQDSSKVLETWIEDQAIANNAVRILDQNGILRVPSVDIFDTFNRKNLGLLCIDEKRKAKFEEYALFDPRSGARMDPVPDGLSWGPFIRKDETRIETSFVANYWRSETALFINGPDSQIDLHGYQSLQEELLQRFGPLHLKWLDRALTKPSFLEDFGKEIDEDTVKDLSLFRTILHRSCFDKYEPKFSAYEGCTVCFEADAMLRSLDISEQSKPNPTDQALELVFAGLKNETLFEPLTNAQLERLLKQHLDSTWHPKNGKFMSLKVTLKSKGVCMAERGRPTSQTLK